MSGSSIIVGFLVIWGIFLMNGKGTFLIAGYNTMSKEKKEEYKENAVAKFMGKMAFTLAFSNLLWILGDLYKLNWLSIFGGILTFSIIIFLVIILNKSNKLKK